MRKINIIGEKFFNNEGLEFEVIKEIKTIKTETYYEIKFTKSGGTKIAEKRNIKKGAIRDDFSKNIYNVACKGKSSSVYPKLNKLAFKRWYAMIERCYCKTSTGFKSYGNKGVKVCDRWLCFDNFLNDLELIEGYDEKKYIEGKIQLDKDLTFKGNNVYSFEKCIFVDAFINKSNKPTTLKEFIAISPNGEKYIFSNQTECARRFGLTARTIGKVLAGQLKTHKGWTFKYNK